MPYLGYKPVSDTQGADFVCLFVCFVLVLETLVSCGRSLKHSVRLTVSMSPLVETLKTTAGVMPRTLDMCQGEVCSTPHKQGV